jgi:hypothetical protein
LILVTGWLHNQSVRAKGIENLLLIKERKPIGGPQPIFPSKLSQTEVYCIPCPFLIVHSN